MRPFPIPGIIVFLSFVLPFLSLTALPRALAQSAVDPSTEELAAITARGRALAEYEISAAKASNALIASHPPIGSFSRYVGQKVNSEWLVAFGEMNAARDAFTVTYQVAVGKKAGEVSVKKVALPREDRGFYFLAARAIDTALHDFRAQGHAFNAAVVPAEAGQFFVYEVPLQTADGVFYMGGDVRYLISADGEKIVEKRQLHNTVMATQNPKAPGTVVAGFHTHTLSNLPEDTDVFYVLTRKPPRQEIIEMPDKRVYEIETDGTIVRKK
jgi:hypothetical protein